MTVVVENVQAAATLQSIDPATGEVVGEVPITPVEKVRPFEGRDAQRRWAKLSLLQGAEAIAPARQALLDRPMSHSPLRREMGKPIKDASGEVKAYAGRSNDTLKEISEALQQETLEDINTKSIIYREPLGICAAITPWNFPLGMPFEAIIPALMAGNAVIVKPSEETPLIAQALVDILNEALPRECAPNRAWQGRAGQRPPAGWKASISSLSQVRVKRGSTSLLRPARC